GGTHQEEVRGVDTRENENEKGNGQDADQLYGIDVASGQAGHLDPDPFHRVVRGREEPPGPEMTSRTGDAEPPGNDAELGLDAVDADTVPQSADVSNQATAGLPKRIVHRNTIHETDRQP